jgi:hypothetical protein
MKLRFVLPALLFALFALPQMSVATPLSGAQTERYLVSCVSQPSRTMDSTTLKSFCECTALQMQKNMTMEDLIAQSGNDQAARNALNKTLTHVYAPCIQYPVHALVTKRCMADTTIKKKSACACAAEQMAAYTAKEAVAQLPGIIAANPNVTDPAEAFMGTKEFETTQEQIADNCGRR